jgi:moderate conductance mechanosensitive channel
MWEFLATSWAVDGTRLWSSVGNWMDEHFFDILAIIICAWLVRHFGGRLAKQILRHTVRSDLYPTKQDRQKRLKTLNSLIGAVTRVGVYVIATILIIGEINPSYTTALFASAGLVTVALGFGAQSLIKDFVSGMFIITENQYRVGDNVSIAGVKGVVEDVTIRTTVLRDLDGNVHHVPNGLIEVTTNTSIGYSSLKEDIIVGKKTNLEQLEHIIAHVGEEMLSLPELKGKLIDPPKLSSYRGYAQDGIAVRITGRTAAGEKWLVRSELYKRLNKAFVAHDITIKANLVLPVVAPAKTK